jgi:hypothetical protein
MTVSRKKAATGAKGKWNRPFTRKERKRLLKACEEVASRLGLSKLPWSYMIASKPKEDSEFTFADAWTMRQGWIGHVTFYPAFFERTFYQQCQTIVHEHLHVAFHPQDQATHQAIYDCVPERDQERAELAINLGRETAISCLQVPLTDLLMPFIKKVLQ